MNSRSYPQFRKLVDTMIRKNVVEAVFIWTSYTDKGKIAADVIEPIMTELNIRCTWTKCYEITFGQGHKVTFMTPEVYVRNMNGRDILAVAAYTDAER